MEVFCVRCFLFFSLLFYFLRPLEGRVVVFVGSYSSSQAFSGFFLETHIYNSSIF